jgi:DNA-binding MarR family transcriptional regulator
VKRNRDVPQVEVDPQALDLGHLGLFVGYAYADHVAERVEAAGFLGLRFSHGFVFQHLIARDCTVGELAERMAVTQQAASKAVAELERLGYVERASDAGDARVRRIRLSARGRGAVAAARRTRARLERRLETRLGARSLAQARALLAQALAALGGAPAVRRRRVRPPR